MFVFVLRFPSQEEGIVTSRKTMSEGMACRVRSDVEVGSRSARTDECEFLGLHWPINQIQPSLEAMTAASTRFRAPTF